MSQAIEYPDINAKTEGDCGYVASFSGSGKPKVGIYAKSKYAAILIAREHYKPAKSKQHMVDCMLAERADGSVVAQSTAQF